MARRSPWRVTNTWGPIIQEGQSPKIPPAKTLAGAKRTWRIRTGRQGDTGVMQHPKKVVVYDQEQHFQDLKDLPLILLFGGIYPTNSSLVGLNQCKINFNRLKFPFSAATTTDASMIRYPP